MLRPTLNDPDEFPSDSVLAKPFGRSMAAWDAFMTMLKSDYPQMSVDWRYYNDGKTWLCKVTQKARTIFWVSAWDKFFKISFYFTAKAERAITASGLERRAEVFFSAPQGPVQAAADHHRSAKKNRLAAHKGTDRDQAEDEIIAALFFPITNH